VMFECYSPIIQHVFRFGLIHRVALWPCYSL
jgi:hypothetical protein